MVHTFEKSVLWLIILLIEIFQQINQIKKWVTDITEFSFPSGKVYLSPNIDCFDGLSLSWKIGTSPNESLANDMLDDAILTLKDDESPIVHSDRGIIIGGLPALNECLKLGSSGQCLEKLFARQLNL